ncbi:MAG: SDR family NAD(P)-dependent oxidoreductase [Pseudonocardia sp.]
MPDNPPASPENGTSRIAVVTGGASGIGYALATALVARGDSVTIADLDRNRAVQAAEKLGAAHPGQVRGAAVDVRDAAAVAALIRSVTDQHGRLDLLFNNAGIGVNGAAEEHTLDHWNRAIDINLRGVVHGVHAAYPIMLEQGFGHIVNTASLAGLVPSPNKPAYTATKSAVVGLSLALRSEAASRGVRVSVVCPGYVDTPLLDNANPDLPQTSTGPRAREIAVRVQRRLYAPDQLARDVLRGVDRDRAVIVAPASARLAWRVARLSPSLVLSLASRLAVQLRAETETLDRTPSPRG